MKIVSDGKSDNTLILDDSGELMRNVVGVKIIITPGKYVDVELTVTDVELEIKTELCLCASRDDAPCICGKRYKTKIESIEVSGGVI